MKFGQWLGFLSLLVSLYILWKIQQLLLLVFTAVILTIALNRIVRYWQRFGIKRPLAIAITVISSLIVTVLIFVLIVPPFFEQFQNLIALLPSAWERIRSQIDIFKQQQLQFEWLPPLPTQAVLIERLHPLGTALFNNFFAVFSNSLAVVLQLLLIFILTLMMLVSPQGYRKAFLILFPSFYRQRADEILSASEEALGNWLIGIVITSTFIGTLSGLSLLVLQINLVLVHALIAGLLNFIPNIGPMLSMIFPITIALLDSPWKIGAIVVAYIIIQQLESYWLTPTIMAKQVSVLPAVTLLAQIFFAQAFGFFGLLLALPLTVVASILIEEILFKDILDKWEISPSSDLIFARSFPSHEPENTSMDR